MKTSTTRMASDRPREVRHDRSDLQAWKPLSSLVHPLTVFWVGVLVINDHWLKTHHPSFLTGKLSDIAFMIVAPLWLQASYLLIASRRTPQTEQRALIICISIIAVSFALMQTTQAGDTVYEYGLGALQFPARALWAAITGATTAYSPVTATPDITDLLCLPCVTAAWWVGTRARERVGVKVPPP